MSDWLAALLLGLIEGLTEFIPVSSTGHLLLAEQWLPRQSDLFNIVVQSGAAVALVPLFWGKSVALVSVYRTVPVWNTYVRWHTETPWLLRFFDQIRFFPVTAAELLKYRE